MTGVEDAGGRYLRQRPRITCSAGEPLNLEVIRWFRAQYGVTCSTTKASPRATCCAATSLGTTCAKARWAADAGLEVAILDEDEQPLPSGERGEICLRARSNPHYPAATGTAGGHRGGVRRRVVPTKDAATEDEDGYVWYAGAPTT